MNECQDLLLPMAVHAPTCYGGMHRSPFVHCLSVDTRFNKCAHLISEKIIVQKLLHKPAFTRHIYTAT